MGQPTAVVFPGQGSQRAGMAIDFANAFAEAREVFDIASSTLGFDVRATCENDAERLSMTEFTQPCLLASEIAMFRSLKNHYSFDPEYFGGHSLGEFTGLVAGEVIPLEVGLKLVRARGELMQRSFSMDAGGMVALIMDAIPLGQIEELADKYGIDVANVNSRSQVVMSGEKKRLEQFREAVRARYPDDELQFVTLSVRTPFHSRHMIEAEKAFRQSLEESLDRIDSAKAPRCLSNYTGKFHESSSRNVVEALAKQVSGRVRWTDNMASLAARSNQIVEVGPNRPLSGFFKSAGIALQSVIDIRTAKRTFGDPR